MFSTWVALSVLWYFNFHENKFLFYCILCTYARTNCISTLLNKSAETMHINTTATYHAKMKCVSLQWNSIFYLVPPFILQFFKLLVWNLKQICFLKVLLISPLFLDYFLCYFTLWGSTMHGILIWSLLVSMIGY